MRRVEMESSCRRRWELGHEGQPRNKRYRDNDLTYPLV